MENLKGFGELRALADFGTPEVDEVYEYTETDADHADYKHGPCRGQVVEHEYTKVTACGCDDERGNQKCGDCRSGDIGVGIFPQLGIATIKRWRGEE